MYSLIYRSIAVENLDSSEIRGINEKSMAFNQEHGITGCLLHHQGRFLQLLEGNKKSVLDLFQRIEKDKKHHSVLVLHTQNSVIRMFHNWSMIFDDVHKESVNKMKYFEKIFHSSNAASAPNTSKLHLWKKVNNILKEERNSERIP